MKDLFKMYLPGFVLLLAGFVVAFQFIKPAPPEKVVMVSGGASGSYHAFAKRYAERLAEEGIELEIRNTAGSVENMSLLHVKVAQVALMQGGIQDPMRVELGGQALNSLGSLFYEPLWLFHRAGLNLDRLANLRGLKVAIGVPGSGTYALVLPLLQSNGLDKTQLTLMDYSNQQASEALLAGEIDAMFMVSAAQNALVNKLLRAPEVRLASFERAAAYAQRHHFLTRLTLPEGVVDLAQNIPARDIQLLAPAANLVVNADVHPAIIDLLLQAAKSVHANGDWFAEPGEFPQASMLAYPLASEAERFYRNGPPFLQRYLPFWAASLIDRLKVMLLPLVVLLLPLIKVMPPLYDWRMRARIYRWYEQLESVDRGLAEQTLSLAEARDQLRRIEKDLWRVHVPLAFAHQLYHLRQHIDMVRRRCD